MSKQELVNRTNALYERMKNGQVTFSDIEEAMAFSPVAGTIVSKGGDKLGEAAIKAYHKLLGKPRYGEAMKRIGLAERKFPELKQYRKSFDEIRDGVYGASRSGMDGVKKRALDEKDLDAVSSYHRVLQDGKVIAPDEVGAYKRGFDWFDEWKTSQEFGKRIDAYQKNMWKNTNYTKEDLVEMLAKDSDELYSIGKTIEKAELKLGRKLTDRDISVILK